MSREPVTPAQEAVTSAMLGGIIVCAAAAYLVLRSIGDWGVADAAVVGIASFIMCGYIVPHTVAWWLGRPLHHIMNPAQNHK
jgi:putative flippase GtrA